MIEALYQLDSAPEIQRLLCCPPLDPLMAGLSRAGEGWGLAVVAVALAWNANRDRRAALRSALRGLVALACTGLLVQVLKRIIHAPRPLHLLGPERVRVLLEPLHHMSFPSGHSAAAAALALWAWREGSPGTRWWACLFAFLCGLSRVYVGAHWVTDVLAGWLLGIAAATAVCRLWRAPRRACGGLAGADPAPAGTPAAAVAPEVDPCP